MTTTCTNCHIRVTADDLALCARCYDLAGLENEHQDGLHVDNVPTCPMCFRDLVLVDRSRRVRSHAACYEAGTHDKTREGREACRKFGRHV